MKSNYSHTSTVMNPNSFAGSISVKLGWLSSVMINTNVLCK